MFVEQKKVITVGGSGAVTIKSMAGICLQKGETVKVSYAANKIIIERVKV